MNRFQFKKLFILFLLLTSAIEISAMIDNRFLPLYRPEYTRYPCKRSVLSSNVFFLFSMGGRSFDECNVNVPEIFGKYDLINISKALEATGSLDPARNVRNPLSPQWQSLTRIPWELEGSIEGAGWWYGYEQAFNDFSLGISLYALKVIAKQSVILPESTITEMRLNKGGETQLRQEQLQANKLLGIESLQFNKSGFADVDLYARYGIVKEYTHKFKKS